MPHTPKSTASVKSIHGQHHHHRPKKKSTSSIRSNKLPKIMSGQSVLEEEEEESPSDIYNYREELTYLFFTSIIEHVIESRETLEIDSPFNVGTKTPDRLPPVANDSQGLESQPTKAEKTRRLKSAQRLRSKSRINRKTSRHEKQGSTTSKRSVGSMISESESDRRFNMKSVVSIGRDYSVMDYPDDRNQKSKKEKMDLNWIVKPEDKVEKIVFKNGNVYEGQTSRWLMHGKGIYTWSDGTSYTGKFKDGVPEGEGQMTLSDLNTYDGEFSEGLFHGMGVFSITNSPGVYKGFWKKGKKHGKGWYLYEQDNWYEGEWLEDKRHGEGFRQYKNGAKYRGTWCDNMKSGEGTMLWENNDFYVGGWKNDKPNGYGEYIWNVPFSKRLVFPYCSWYKGSWLDGVRNGAGVMNFGTEGGAKLAGIWLNNQKHGAGIMICGNGLTLQCNPLFENDKPVHWKSVNRTVEVEDEVRENKKKKDTKKEKNAKSEVLEVDDKNAYRRIVKKIYAKVPLENFDNKILRMLTHNSLRMCEKHFVELDNSNSNKTTFCPLEIPIHTVTEELDLSYFIDTIWNYYFPNEDTKGRKNESKLISKPVGGNRSGGESKENHVTNKDEEEKLLRNLITLYLPKLMQIYQQYATITTGEQNVNQRVVLTRFFLWQLLRDIGLPHSVPLIDADIFMAKNPRCCLGSDHDPFELIYFWQFIQTLLGCAWLLKVTRISQNVVTYINGTICGIFRDFMEDAVLPNAGKFIGTCLTIHKDIVPVKCVYELYLQIGEPISVYDFLYFTCIENDKEPPCYTVIDSEENQSKNIRDGNNVAVGDKIIYMQVKEDIISRTNQNSPKERHIHQYADLFLSTMYTFRGLGRMKIIQLLRKICPLIVTHRKLQLDYKLTFIEFYEALLLCAYEKAEIQRIEEEEALPEMEILKPIDISPLKLGHKKKKHK